VVTAAVFLVVTAAGAELVVAGAVLAAAGVVRVLVAVVGAATVGAYRLFLCSRTIITSLGSTDIIQTLHRQTFNRIASSSTILLDRNRLVRQVVCTGGCLAVNSLPGNRLAGIRFED
jgi:hypothetical protein